MKPRKFFLIICLLNFFFTAFSQDTVNVYKKGDHYYFDHIVRPQENLYGISQKYHIKTNDIVKKIPNNRALVKPGDRVSIPFNSENIRKYRLIFRYEINEGDNLYRISRLFNVDQDEIIRQNQLKSKNLYVGISLAINLLSAKASTEQGTAVESAALSADINKPLTDKATGTRYRYENIHTVSQGETLYFIAQQYGIDIDSLKHWNHLVENTIKPGQKLTIKHNDPDLASPKAEVKNDDAEEASKGLDKKKGLAFLENIKTKRITNRKLALHPSLPVGTYIKVVNPENSYTTLVRVVGRIKKEATDKGAIIQLNAEACKALGVDRPSFFVELIYSDPD